MPKTGVELVALAEASAMTQQRLALRREAVVRWLRANPGDTLAACKRATGASEVLVKRVAEEVGYVAGRPDDICRAVNVGALIRRLKGAA